MVAYYRLNELGYVLAPGPHLLAPEEIEPVAAATGLLQAAEMRAAAIVAEAEVTYARRHEEGHADGLALARREAAERLLREGALMDEGLRAVEAEMARVVSVCVRKLVEDFDDRARAEASVRGALRQMRREKRCELRVSPEHYPSFRAGIGAIIADFPEIELIDVVEDTALVPPQIVLESSLGRVAVTFEASLSEIEALIRSVADEVERSQAAAA